LQLFLNSGIEHRHFFLDQGPNRFETTDELNARYLRGAVWTGCRAVEACLKTAGMTPKDVDLFVVCTSTGYVCPDVGSRLIAHMGFRSNVQRAPVVGLGCAGAIPALQRATDYARSYAGKVSLMLAVEICSACYYVDHTLETVVGNAICSDGAAAFLLRSGPASEHAYPEIVDFESFVDSRQIENVGFEHKQGKLRIILAMAVRDLAAPIIEQALDPLLQRHGLTRSDIRFWVAHPGGRKVIDNVQKSLGLSDAQVRYSNDVLRNFGNMSSPTVMFVLDEVVRKGDPRPGDWGIMIALGPGMAAEVALLRW